MRQVVTFILIVLSLNVYCQKTYDKDTITINLINDTDFSKFLYKTKNYAFSLSLKDICENNNLFKRSFPATLKDNTFKEDTIWLDKFIKQKKEQDIKLLCWQKIEKKDAYIINTDTNEKVSQILYVTSHDYMLCYFQYFDCKTGLIILEKKEPWIGCPPF